MAINYQVFGHTGASLLYTDSFDRAAVNPAPDGNNWSGLGTSGTTPFGWSIVSGELTGPVSGSSADQLVFME